MVDLNATLIAQIINFLLLVFILTKVAYKPLMKMLADRQTRIEESIRAAEEGQAAAEELKRQYEEHLAEARIKAQAIVEKAAKTAEQTKEEIVATARIEYARLLKEAQEEIAREREHALAQLRGEVVALSVACASKIVEENMDMEKNAKLVEKFMKQLDEQKGGLPC